MAAAAGVTVIVAVPGAEAHPDEFVSVTESEAVPDAPTLKVIWSVPCPEVIVPFDKDQLKTFPACTGTEAVRPVCPATAEAGAVMTGVAGVGLTETVVVPAGEAQPFTDTVTL